ncbi:hypothetical protein [Streptomyces endophytica]|uniref:Integral membrane protein n=1 Tax=Streptomyces endophytica TaxID=2991496 RepID=A0ABY6PAW8_9ACTN|nr:hypothetical protein [Streptomyces endophytica]UZJ30941.1 hypothetical protein OJ254_12025 [Streptomyces endophytica]
MDQHARRHGARAARSHGTVEGEHGATAGPRPGSAEAEGASGSPGTSRLAAMAERVPATVAWPLIAALAFGLFTIFRTHTAGTKGGPALLYGVAAAVVSGVLGLLVAHFQSSMLTETRALSYGALFGLSIGWVYSLGGESILKSCIFGFVMGGIMFLSALYLFRTHSAREPHGRHRPHEEHGTRRRSLPAATH